MDWTILKAVKISLLAILTVGLPQLIRHFGRSYAAEVFASTPHLRRTFLVLADCAYYLSFAAYVLVNVHFERPPRFDAAGNGIFRFIWH